MSQYGSPPDPDQPGQPAPGAGGPPHSYGEPQPYGQPAPYGEPTPYAPPPANPYGGAPDTGYAPSAQAPPYGYAAWIKRVAAYLIDIVLSALSALPLWIGYGVLLSHLHTTTNPDGTSTAHYDGSATPAVVLILIGIATSLAFGIWNIYIRQGRTGYTLGKSALGIRLVSEVDGQPIGALMAFVRQICHILDALPCYLGYFWPLWDRKSQTFADKIMHTLVVNRPPS